MIERGRSDAGHDDGCSCDYFLIDDGVDTGGSCCWEAAFDSSWEANFSLSRP